MNLRIWLGHAGGSILRHEHKRCPRRSSRWNGLIVLSLMLLAGIPVHTLAQDATPTPAGTPTAAPTETPLPSATPTNTPAPAETPAPPPTPTPSPVPTTVPTATPQPTPTISPTATGTPTPEAASTPGDQPRQPKGANASTSAVTAEAATPTSITVTAEADAWVEQDNPARNNGTSTTFIIDTTPRREAYVRFTVSGLTGVVQQATLRLFATDGTSDGPAASLAGNNWTETGITWNTKPPLLSIGVDDKRKITANTWVEFNVTSLVTGDGTYTFTFLPASADGVTFSAREAGASGPQLVITYDPSGISTAEITPAPSPTLTPTPAATSSPTPLPTLTATPTATSGSSQTIVLNPEADAWVEQANPAKNNGTASTLIIDGDPWRETYIRFNVQGVGTIQQARLRLFASNGTYKASQVYLAGNGWTETGITWNTKPAVLGSGVAGPASFPDNTWVEYDVTSLVTGNGQVTFTFPPLTSDGTTYTSRETGTPPQLVITFTGSTTATATPVPTATTAPTLTPTSTPTSTPPPTPTATATLATPTSTPTATPTSTPTLAPNATASPTPAFTPTSPPTAAPTATSTPTNTPTPLPTSTPTLAPTATASPTPTLIPTSTPTATPAPTSTSTTTPTPTPTATTGTTAVVMAAGDIVCGAKTTSSWCRQQQTSDLILAHNPDAVLALGDVQYECAQMSDFTTYFDPTWGRFKTKIYPATGNHEYKTSTNPSDVCYGAPPNAQDYFAYFGPVAGDPAAGYYSFNLGAWHLIALNSNCSQVGGCAAGSPQERWLRADLQANPTACTLAFMHYPRFSTVAPYTSMQALWQALYDNGAEIVLAAHDHHYERYDPRTPAGGADPTWGIREFIVGTGGKQPNQSFGTMDQPAAKGTVPGVLKLTLRATGYDWQFVPITGYTYNDSGSGTCHGLPSSASSGGTLAGIMTDAQPSDTLAAPPRLTDHEHPLANLTAAFSRISRPDTLSNQGLLGWLLGTLLALAGLVQFRRFVNTLYESSPPSRPARGRHRQPAGKAHGWARGWPAMLRATMIVAAATSLLVVQPAPASDSGPIQTMPGLTDQMLATVDLGDLPHPPTIMALARFTYQPGATFANLEVPGPEIIVLESGTLTVDLRGETEDAADVEDIRQLLVPAQPGREAMSTPEPERFRFTMQPGDRLLVPADTPHTITNPGDTPAVYLAAAITPQPPDMSGPIWPPAGVEPLALPTGIALEPLGAGYGQAASLPHGAAQVRLDRVTLEPGTVIPNLSCAGTESWYVERGTLAIALQQGQAAVARPAAAQSSSPAPPLARGGNATLPAGDALLVQAGCAATVRNAGTEPLVIVILSVSAHPIALATPAATSGSE